MRWKHIFTTTSYLGPENWPPRTGCQVGASASGGTLFPSVRLQDGDEFELGEFKLKILHTPGHTPEHISFLVEEQGEPTAIFTGGALIMGGAARVDLLGSRVAPFLARWLHQTIHGKLLNTAGQREGLSHPWWRIFLLGGRPGKR